LGSINDGNKEKEARTRKKHKRKETILEWRDIGWLQ
jgi:hypothetical protein